MNKTTPIYSSIKIFMTVIWLLFFNTNLSAQYVFTPKNLSENASIHNKVEYIDVNQLDLTFEQIRNNKTFQFRPLKIENKDFGFTNHNYWMRFQLNNETEEELVYFLETARPITDIAELYAIKNNRKITKYLSGDAIPLTERSFDHRKTIFKITLNPSEQQEFYLHLKSDGEQLSIPMVLHTLQNLLKTTSFEQFVFGLFYGIMFITAVLYLFFFFAMRDKRFFYYSMYVVFIALLQFSVDGYFYQLITPQSGWLSLHSVLLSACIANFFLGRYAQLYLKIEDFSKFINLSFYVLYALDFLLLLYLFFIDDIKLGYPIANILGLILLILIITSQVIIYIKQKK